MKTAEEVAQLRTMVQLAGFTAWKNAGKRGSIVMATGTGKSKIAIDRCVEIYDNMSALDLPMHKDDKRPILLVTRTEKLRDENWPAEFEKWDRHGGAIVLVKRICYASLQKEKGNRYQFVILDEAHRLTAKNAEAFQEDNLLTVFFSENVADEVMALTATEPDKDRDLMKYQIFQQIAPVCFRYTRNQGIRDGIIPAARIKIIHIPLERVIKNVPAGTKANPFFTTEQSAYEYIDKLTKKAQASKKVKWAQAMYGKRRRFIAGLKSKNRVALKLMEKVCPGNRVLIFCGTIEQSEQLCGINVYNSSPEAKKRDQLTRFKNKELDHLGVVDAVNEGHNIDDLDHLIIVQLNSNERDLIQRLGRIRHVEGKEHCVYILVSQGTQDESWVRQATESIDPQHIDYLSYLEVLK